MDTGQVRCGDSLIKQYTLDVALIYSCSQLLASYAHLGNQFNKL